MTDPSPASASNRPGPTPALKLLSTLALLFFAAYWVAGAISVMVSSANLIHSAVENTYPESPNIYEAIHAAQTGHLYVSVSDPPYVLQPYGPLFYVINAGIAKGAHLDLDLVTVRARALALCCFLLAGCMAFLIARRLKFSALESLCAAAMLMAQPEFLHWNVTVRPDILALLAMLICLFVAVNDSWPETPRYVLAGVFGGLAFLLKQPGFAAPLAIFAVLAFRGKYRQAAAVVLGAAAPVILLFGALLLRHEPFLAQFTMVGKSPWSLANGIDFTIHHPAFVGLLVPLAIGAMGFAIAIRSEAEPQMVASFAAASWLVGLSGIPQLGGDYNYFLPGLAGCALLLPFVIRTIRQGVRTPAVFALVIVALLALLPGQLKSAVAATREFRLTGPSAAGSLYTPLQHFHILSDRPAYALHGRDPDFLDPFSTHALELAGHFDSAPIVENIQRGGYDLVILACNNGSNVICSYRGVSYFSVPLVNALNAHYVVSCIAYRSAMVLKPRDREVIVAPVALQAALGAPCGTARSGYPPSLTLAPGAR